MNPVLAIIVLVLVLTILWKSWRQKKVYNYPPGPPRLPFIGSYLHLLWIDYYKPHVALQTLKEYYKSPIIGFGMGPHNVTVASDYESIKEVFSNPNLQGRLDILPARLRTFNKVLGIFGGEGDDWLHLRRSSLRSLRDFGFGRRSDSFETVVAEEAKAMVEHLNDINGKPVLLPDELYPTFFNLILHLVHGVRLPETDRGVLENPRKAVAPLCQPHPLPGMTESAIWPNFRNRLHAGRGAYLLKCYQAAVVARISHMGRNALRIGTSLDATGRILAIWPWLHDFFPTLTGGTEIEDCSEQFKVFIKKSYNKHLTDFDEEVLRDLLDVLIKYKTRYPTWTDEQLMITCEDLMFPNATISIVMAFTLAILSENQDKIKKCQKEIDEVVGRGRLPTLDDRQRLVMVEACIRETLRIQVPVPIGLGHRCTADTTLGGYDVPENTLVITNLQSMHNDPAVWKDPENFRPERFLEPGAKDTTFPFGLGKRVCAAETYARQNLFIVLATILQNFDLKTEVPLDPKRYRCGFAVAPNADFSMRFIPRS